MDTGTVTSTGKRLSGCTCLILVLFLGCAAQVPQTSSQQLANETADGMFAGYFKTETARLSDRCLADVKNLEDWKQKRITYKKQLLEMLGLDPLPPKTDLKPVVTGRIEHDQFVVEKIYFQSRPGLYVTGNLYIPRNLDAPAPAVLYVCGHSQVKKDGISYGNKTHYQHHPAWFARNGYVSLVIDSLQLGEIEGIHHGTYRYDMWWWNSRGYTPAGVEAWNCIRALDYLQTRPEVDSRRLGVTGISGGGAYSWWLAAVDERIKAAVPVAGMTDLQNYVVDGCVERHCDCMFLVNTYRWDYPQVAAMVAPRALLISNSDKDELFPLDGVVRLHEKVRGIYRLYGAEDKLGLCITEGPHKDTQNSRVNAFEWFNRFLKGEDVLIDKPAVKFFEPEQLKVFQALPADQLNTRIQESFTSRAAVPALPETAEQWNAQQRDQIKILREKSLRGWPSDTDAGPLNLTRVSSLERNNISLRVFEFNSQGGIVLPLYVMRRADLKKPRRIILNVIDRQQWPRFAAALCVGFPEIFESLAVPQGDEDTFKRLTQAVINSADAIAYLPPRGIGPTAVGGEEFAHTQLRRRFMLLGQTLDGMQLWDITRAAAALRNIKSFASVPLYLQAKANMAGIVLYSPLFEESIEGLLLTDLPQSHQQGPCFLNVLRYLDMPQAVAMAASRSRVSIFNSDADNWRFAVGVAKAMGWPTNQLQIQETSADNDCADFLP